MTKTQQPAARPRPIDELLNLPREQWSVVERWSAAGLQTHDLPSGTRVAGRKRDAIDLLGAGILTDELFSACVDIARARAAGKPLTKEQVLASLEFVRLAAQSYVAWIHDPDGNRWIAAELDGAAYASLEPADRRYLEGVINEDADIGAVEGVTA